MRRGALHYSGSGMGQWLAVARGYELSGSIKCEEFIYLEIVDLLRTPLHGVPRLIQLATASSYGWVNITFTR
jgi:hypothetical protein